LERNTVRSIENFSTGKRGSICAEEFLKKNYIVIFLYRNNSLMPFFNHFSLKEFFDNSSLETSSSYLSLNGNLLDRVAKYKIEYDKYKDKLHLVSFTDVDDYLKKYQYVEIFILDLL